MKCICCILLMMASLAAAPVKRLTDANGDSLAVIVPAGTPLLHTPQFRADDLVPDLRGMEEAVKVNVVAATPAAAEAARDIVRRAYPAGARPVVSVVIGTVSKEKTMAADVVMTKGGDEQRSHIFISGQAEKAATAAEAVARTLAALTETLKFVGCTVEDVAQAKFFATADAMRPAALDEVKKFFNKGPVSLVWVEWKSELPVEIELVASGPPAAADAPAIEYLTPPGKTASPLFARVVRVNRGDLIYLGDLYASKPGNGQEQVLSIFDQLQQVLKQTDSDMRHLVKATYYVSDDDASKQLNVLRPRFYDPARPPAASKAMVPEVGVADRSISIDMIAVTKEER